MKKIIIAVLAVIAFNFSAHAEETTSEKLGAAKVRHAELVKELEAAKVRHAELVKEISKLENPSTKEISLDILILAKRQYNEVSNKVVSLTKELVEKISKKGE
jgi:hypothetical protein